MYISKSHQQSDVFKAVPLNDGDWHIYDNDILPEITRHFCLNICMAYHSLDRESNDWKNALISTAINRMIYNTEMEELLLRFQALNGTTENRYDQIGRAHV